MTRGEFGWSRGPTSDRLRADNDRLRRSNRLLQETLATQHVEEQRLQSEVRRRRRSERDLRAAAARLQDMTEQLEKANNALLRSNDDLEQFAYIASHDLKEPLRVISQYAQLFSERYGREIEPRQEKYLRYISEGAERMSALVRDLLEYSRVTTDRVSFEPVDCHDVMDRVLSNLQPALAESGGKVIVKGPLPTLYANSSQLEQLFQNLIGNSLKFRSAVPPEITLAVQSGSAGQTIAVADNGIGIDPAYHDRIFNIFQRLHTRDQYSGTGIGLAVVRRILQRHEAKIEVESHPGKGTTFFLTFPT